MYATRGGESERGARAPRLPAAAAARLAGGVAPARGPRERRRRSARGAHAPTWTVPPGPGGTWRDRRDLDFWRDRRDPKLKDAFLGRRRDPRKLGLESESETCERHGAGGNARARRRRSAATGSARRRRHREARRLQRAVRGASRGARAWDGGAGAASAASRRRASGEHRRGGRRVELPAGLQERTGSSRGKGLGVEGQDPKTHPPAGLKTLRLSSRHESRLKTQSPPATSIFWGSRRPAVFCQQFVHNCIQFVDKKESLFLPLHPRGPSRPRTSTRTTTRG